MGDGRSRTSPHLTSMLKGAPYSRSMQDTAFPSIGFIQPCCIRQIPLATMLLKVTLLSFVILARAQFPPSPGCTTLRPIFLSIADNTSTVFATTTTISSKVDCRGCSLVTSTVNYPNPVCKLFLIAKCFQTTMRDTPDRMLTAAVTHHHSNRIRNPFDFPSL